MGDKSFKRKVYIFVNRSKIYSAVYAITLILSIIPLMFKEMTTTFYVMELIAVSFFIIDYILRFICSEVTFGIGKKSFLRYPLTPYAIIDALSILPFFLQMFSFLVPIRVISFLKLLRVFKVLRYNKQIIILKEAIRREATILTALLAFVSLYIFVMALIVFQIEPQTFKTFFDAIYWATISLTTVGYGDLYAVTDLGRAVSIISAIIGVGIIALPSGIIAASFVETYKDYSECSHKTRNKK